MISLKHCDTEKRSYRIWLSINTLLMFFLFAAIMAAPAFPYHWDTFYRYLYKIPAVVLLLLYAYYRRWSDRTEVKLCILFCIWALISRFLNGDFALTDGGYVLNIAVSCMFLPLCILLDEKHRALFLDLISAAVCIFFTFGAVHGIYTAVTDVLVENPFSAWYFSEIGYDMRLYMYGANPNTVGNWMLISIGLLVYQFFKRKNYAVKGLIVLMLAADFTAAALADSRNAMLGISAGAAALALLLCMRYLPFKKKSISAAASIVIMFAALAVTYISFAGARNIVNFAAAEYREAENAEAAETVYIPEERYYTAYLSASSEEEDEESGGEEDQRLYKDDRGFSDSGRIPIYKSAFTSIKEEPLRLIRGSMSGNIMDITNQYSDHEIGHFHNSLIQALQFAGLPGFIPALLFMILTAVRAVKLFFSKNERSDMAVKALVIILPGLYIYNMLETSIFQSLDFRSAAFFVISGAVLAYSYEICPPKKKK